jgi:cytidylate kinase
MNPLTITISRQLGSGGAYIGQKLSKKLNIQYADREIIGKAANQLSVLENELEARDEKILSFWQSFVQFNATVSDVYVPPKKSAPTDLELFKTETEIIRKMVKEHPAVIVGRCGFHIFREYTDCVKVFLHSGRNFRIRRVSELYDVPKETAAKMIDKNDRERALYCKTFTGKEWTDAKNYDISIDTGKIGLDKTVELILNYLELVKLP